MSRILILGSKGMFGTDALPLFARAGHEVTGADLPEVDITSADSLTRCFDAARPQVVVSAAAYTKVDDAEREPEEARRINGDGARRVAEACREIGALLVHLSTDYVFRGDKAEGYLPGDEPGPPVNAYGTSKLEGERAVQGVLGDGGLLLCRTQWLYGSRGPNFVETILKLARSRDEIRVVDDQWGVPTLASDLARQVLVLLDSGARGVRHTVGGGGPVTWFTFASAIVGGAGLPCRVAPCATAEYPRPAKRPSHAWLRSEGVPEASVRHWREALNEHLRTLRAA